MEKEEKVKRKLGVKIDVCQRVTERKLIFFGHV